MNKVTLLGNLGRDPEMRYTQDGIPVTTMSVGASTGYGDKKKTIWFRVSAWRKLAEACSEYLEKGCKVYVEGSFVDEPKVYQKKDGTYGCSYEVTASHVEFITMESRGGQPSVGDSQSQAMQEDISF